MCKDTDERDDMATRTAEREQFLADILTTAIEGGVNYWAFTKDYVWFDGEQAAETAATVVDLADASTFEVTITTIATGIGRIKRGEVGVRGDLLDAIESGDAENDAGNIDADGADVIVQAALFGEVMYG